jgi:hypothetical protein
LRGQTADHAEAGVCPENIARKSPSRNRQSPPVAGGRVRGNPNVARKTDQVEISIRSRAKRIVGLRPVDTFPTIPVVSVGGGIDVHLLVPRDSV